MTDVFAPNSAVADEPAWKAFEDGCPNCGSRPHDAPEGTNIHDEPHWDNAHCWKCGFRFGTNNVSNEQQMYEAFKRFMASQPDYQHPTLQPPTSGTEDELRRQLAEALADNARLRPGAEGVTSQRDGFSPAAAPSLPDQPRSTIAGQYGAPSPMGATPDTMPGETDRSLANPAANPPPTGEQTGQVPPPGTLPPQGDNQGR